MGIKVMFKDIRRIISLSIRTIAGLHLFTSSMFEISQTEGASMLPTVQSNGDFCIVDKRYKNGNKIEMGDIIVARKPTQPDSWVCKRITGMPGDIIIIDPSRGHIEKMREKFNNIISNDDDCEINKNDSIKENEFNSRFKEIKLNKNGFDRSPYDQFIVVPDGHVWVTGDNLSDSVDSRTYSVLPMGLIGGKIIIGMYLPNWMNFKGEYYRFLANTFHEV
ncbi:hypothetical protein C6P40_002639 [Pichia californica]|uniref:Mitochondrial inner membrane protease subunit n=1 Tax=Pichia californica TaxID=460514 RepID=A0A9P6WJJ3_9ASCO|nr:hypothetical protein C6P42_000911 [[Candida] californica]KAG0687223.1 hypothetical protein C6P40_002639 [[Candida] californica]